jgi:hypothetical protein
VNPAELEEVVERLLVEGIPPTAVARALTLSVELCREAKSLLQVRRYGTDDLAEYTKQAQWDAIEHVRWVMAHGSAAEKTRFAAATLKAPMQRTARGTDEKQEKARAEVEEMMAGMRGDGDDPPPELEERSRFVAKGEA